MDRIEYVYTFGMDADTIDRRLAKHEVGVLALADDSEAYAVPVGYHYDGTSQATDLASPLPMEIDRYLTEANHGQRFDYQEFLDRVTEREGVDRADANYHAQQLLAVVAAVVPPGNLEKVRDQLPEDFEGLFEHVDAAEQ